MEKAMAGKNVALILAAGKGVRLGTTKEKAFVPLAGRPLLAWTLSVFASFPGIDEVIIVVPPGRKEACWQEVLSPYGFEQARMVVGGAERQDSLQHGFAEIKEPCNLVVIHDGVRPFLTHEILRLSLEAAEEYGASAVAVAVKDTIKIGDERGMVEKTLDRSRLWSVQTPQTFKYDLLRQALAEARTTNVHGTDDASLVERIGKPVKIVAGSYENIKITTPEDLLLGEILAQRRFPARQQ